MSRKSRWIWLVLALSCGVLAYGINLSLSPHLLSFSAGQPITLVAESPDAQFIAAAGRNWDKTQPQIHVWQVRDQELHYTRPLTCYATALAISPDSQHLLVASDDGALTMWHLATGKHVRNVFKPQPSPSRTDYCRNPIFGTFHRDAIYRIAFHPQGNLVAVSRRGGIILIVQVHSGEIIHELRGHPYEDIPDAYHTVWDVAFTADGRWVASVGGDGSIHLWDHADGTLIETLQPQSPDPVYAISTHAHRQAATIFRELAHIEVWSFTTGEMRSQQTLHKPPAGDVAFSPDGAVVAVGGFARDMITYSFLGAHSTIYLCAAADTRRCHALRGHRDKVSSLAFSQDGERLISGSRDGTVRLWRVPDFDA